MVKSVRLKRVCLEGWVLAHRSLQLPARQGVCCSVPRATRTHGVVASVFCSLRRAIVSLAFLVRLLHQVCTRRSTHSFVFLSSYIGDKIREDLASCKHPEYQAVDPIACVPRLLAPLILPRLQPVGLPRPPTRRRLLPETRPHSRLAARYVTLSRVTCRVKRC